MCCFSLINDVREQFLTGALFEFTLKLLLYKKGDSMCFDS